MHATGEQKDSSFCKLKSTIDIRIMFYTCAAGQNIWMPFCGPLSSTLMPFVNIGWQRKTKTLLSQGNPEPRVISSNMLSAKPRVHNSLTPLLNIFLQGCLVRMQGKCWRGERKAYLRPEWTLEKPTPSSSWGWGTETVTTLNKEGKAERYSQQCHSHIYEITL